MPAKLTLVDNTKPRLDLGSGAKHDEGYTTLDVSAYFKPDIQGDAVHLPFAGGSFSEVRCHHVLEHMERKFLVPVMNEMWRVLELNGVANIEIPCYPYVEAIADPTHVSFYHSATFDYFVRCDLAHDHGSMANQIPCFENQRRLYDILPWQYQQRTRAMVGGALRRIMLAKVEEA